MLTVTNLAIYCFLRQLERWIKEKDCYPQEIYLQVDGGPDYANRLVSYVLMVNCYVLIIFRLLLGMCELLAQKGICKILTYSRLPTGHTHSVGIYMYY